MQGRYTVIINTKFTTFRHLEQQYAVDLEFFSEQQFHIDQHHLRPLNQGCQHVSGRNLGKPIGRPEIIRPSVCPYSIQYLVKVHHGVAEPPAVILQLRLQGGEGGNDHSNRTCKIKIDPRRILTNKKL